MKDLILQQGDVLFYHITEIPKGAKRHRNNHVAEGEHTGHYHAVEGAEVAVLEHDGTLYVDAPNGGVIQHQEHHEIQLPAGQYEVGIVREYDHFAEEARSIVD